MPTLSPRYNCYIPLICNSKYVLQMQSEDTKQTRNIDADLIDKMLTESVSHLLFFTAPHGETKFFWNKVDFTELSQLE